MDHLLFRPLRADDLPHFFRPERRALGGEWLAQQDAGTLHVVVAELGGVPVGHRCHNFTWRSEEGATYCFAFSVRPRWRARGIGTLLDRHSEGVARGRGFQALQCAIARTNPRGLAWHQRIGYRLLDERVVRWQDADGQHELESWNVERRWAQSLAT